jgi:hypothetical protein
MVQVKCAIIGHEFGWLSFFYCPHTWYSVIFPDVILQLSSHHLSSYFPGGSFHYHPNFTSSTVQGTCYMFKCLVIYTLRLLIMWFCLGRNVFFSILEFPFYIVHHFFIFLLQVLNLGNATISCRMYVKIKEKIIVANKLCTS